MDYYKYPRTFHLPWSKGVSSDDKIISSLEPFITMNIVISEKIDGENFTLYRDHCHARSIDSKNHPSRNFIKELHARIKHEIPDNWRICGENMYAKHSIHYDKLTSYYYVFAIFNEENICLSWKETKEYANILNLETVPELYSGIWDENRIKQCWTNTSSFANEQEGYVVRNQNAFHYDEFSNNVVKYVREKHVRSDSHWMYNPVIPNKIQEKPL